MNKTEFLTKLDALIASQEYEKIATLKEEYAASQVSDPKVDWVAKDALFAEIDTSTLTGNLDTISGNIKTQFAQADDNIEKYNGMRARGLQELAKEIDVDPKHLRVVGGFNYIPDKGMYVFGTAAKVELVHRAQTENRAPRASGYQTQDTAPADPDQLTLWNAFRQWEQENPGELLSYEQIGKIAFVATNGKIATKDRKARTSFNFKKHDKALLSLVRVFDTQPDSETDETDETETT